jgi:glycosyltransferase involved in cell wall biosynthesis
MKKASCMSNRIKHVVIALPVLLIGGTEVQTLSLVKALISGGYRITVCCYYEFDEEVAMWFKDAGAEVLLLRLARDRQRFSISTMLRLVKSLFSMFRRVRPDVVHVQYLAPGLIPILTARLAHVPVIIATVHIAGNIVYGRKAKTLLRIAAYFCTRFICVSRGVEEFWFGNSAIFDPSTVNKSSKHFTVYNAIDTAAIGQVASGIDRHKMKEALGIAGRPVIGIIGRLTHQKGHTILLDAIKEVIKEFPDVVLIIIGAGPDRQKLEEKACALNINKNIVWMGTQPQNKLFEFYAIMDIFAMPSLYEGFGLTAAEAMAAGVPVVGTKVEGLSEVIEDGVSGYLVQTGNWQALADALATLLRNPEQAKAIGQCGRKRAECLFSLERFRTSMIGIYDTF